MNIIKWIKIGKDYSMKYKYFIFRLHFGDCGTYSIGKSFSLQVRKIDESKYNNIGVEYRVSSDNHTSEKLWVIDDVLQDSILTLKGLYFIEED